MQGASVCKFNHVVNADGRPTSCHVARKLYEIQLNSLDPVL